MIIHGSIAMCARLPNLIGLLWISFPFIISPHSQQVNCSFVFSQRKHKPLGVNVLGPAIFSPPNKGHSYFCALSIYSCFFKKFSVIYYVLFTPRIFYMSFIIIIFHFNVFTFSHNFKRPPLYLHPLFPHRKSHSLIKLHLCLHFVCVTYIYPPTYNSLMFIWSCFLGGNTNLITAFFVASPLIFIEPI